MDNGLKNAIKNNNRQKLIQLINDGCDLEDVDKIGKTALSIACEEQSLTMVKLLVNSGANVNHKDILGYCPMDLAYWYGEFSGGRHTAESQQLVNYLQQHGATAAFK